MSTFSQRMVGAAKLEVRIYKEVEVDTLATGQAMTVVVASSIAQGIGAFAQGGLRGLALGAVTALIGWCVWATIIYVIGTKVLPEPQTRSDIGEVLRTTGFAAAPGLLRVLGLVPGLGFLIVVAVSVWMFMAMVIAVRQALDYESLERAVGVCLLGWFCQLVIITLLR
jgi:hypothetical protein